MMYSLYHFMFLLVMGFSFHFLQATYEVVDIGALPSSKEVILKINDKGTVLVGGEVDFRFIPFLYFSSTQEFLSLDMLGRSIIQDLNNQGKILGVDAYNSSPQQTFLWSLEEGKTDITSWLGNTSSNASLCMNDQGVIGGYYWHPVKIENYHFEEQGYPSYIWLGKHAPLICLQNPFMYRGSTCSAIALKAINSMKNAAGYIVAGSNESRGRINLDTRLTAFVWDAYSQKMKLLKSLDADLSSFALDINYATGVVGAVETPQARTDSSHFVFNKHYWHAAFWKSYSNTLIDCGVLEPFTDSIACAINSRWEVVGFCFSPKHGRLNLTEQAAFYDHSSKLQQTGFIWTEQKGMQNLNQLTPEDNQWVITGAFDINKFGQMICMGYSKYDNTANPCYHALLLNPVKNKIQFDKDEVWFDKWVDENIEDQSEDES